MRGLFETWKEFVAKLDVHTREIQTATSSYVKHLKAFSMDRQVNAAEIHAYMKGLMFQFHNKF